MGKWEEKELGEVCYFENGDRGKNYPSRSDYVEKGIPFINTGNLSFNEIKTKNLHYISKEHFNRLSNGKVKNGDIIFCLRGSLGKFALVLNIENGAIASSLVIVRVKEDLDNYFLSYYFQSSIANEMINKYDNGSAQPNLSAANLRKFKIPLPPIATQKQIVSKLDALFARIDKSIGLLEENIQHTKDLMASVLDGEFNLINNEELVIKKLGEVTTKIGSGSTPRGGQKSYKTEGVSLIRSMNVHDMFFKEKNLAFIDDVQAEKLKSVIIEENDVLLNITGASVARCCIVDKSYLPARVNQHVAIIRLNQEFLPEFVMYYLVSPKVKYGLLNSSSGNATREALTKTMIENIEIPYITKEKQTKLVHRIKKGFEIEKNLIAQQSEKLSHLQSLKSSLLDMAFKGGLV